MKIFLLILILLLTVHYDDEDGHREPWAEWREASCINEPIIVMDSTGSNPPCNVNTGLGVTVWKCDDGSDSLYHWSYYTTHWYCDGVIEGRKPTRAEEAISSHSYYLPFVIRPESTPAPAWHGNTPTPAPTMCLSWDNGVCDPTPTPYVICFGPGDDPCPTPAP